MLKFLWICGTAWHKVAHLAQKRMISYAYQNKGGIWMKQQEYEETSYLNTADLKWERSRWLVRKSLNDERRWKPCANEHEKIISVAEKDNYRLELHPNCRCYLEPMKVIEAGYATRDGTNGADYWLYYKQKLPEYYITKKQASGYEKNDRIWAIEK